MLPLAALLTVLPWLLLHRRSRALGLAGRPEETRSTQASVPTTVILELLVAALQTGVSIPRALKSVGGTIGGRSGPVLVRAGRQLELGAPWDQAWRAVSANSAKAGPSELLPVCEALRSAWEAGAAPTASLRAAGEAVHRRQLEASRLAAARLGVRLVLPLGLCLLPAFVLIGLVPVMLSLGSGLFS